MIRKILFTLTLSALLLMGAVAVSADELTEDDTPTVGSYSGEPTQLIGNNAALGNLFITEYGYQVWRWNPELEQGFHALTVDFEDIATGKDTAISSGEAVMLANEGDISLYALPTGECQVDSPMVDGPTYSQVFEC